MIEPDRSSKRTTQDSNITSFVSASESHLPKAFFFSLLKEIGSSQNQRQIIGLERAIERMSNLESSSYSYNCVLKRGLIKLRRSDKELFHAPLVAMDALHLSSSSLLFDREIRIEVRIGESGLDLENISGIHVVIRGMQKIVKTQVLSICSHTVDECDSIVFECDSTNWVLSGTESRARSIKLKLVADYVHDKANRKSRTMMRHSASKKCRSTYTKLVYPKTTPASRLLKSIKAVLRELRTARLYEFLKKGASKLVCNHKTGKQTKSERLTGTGELSRVKIC